MDEYRYDNNDWIFNYDQQELLSKYYAANQFLFQCLDSNSNVTPVIKKILEETLINSKFL